MAFRFITKTLDFFQQPYTVGELIGELVGELNGEFHIELPLNSDGFAFFFSDRQDCVSSTSLSDANTLRFLANFQRKSRQNPTKTGQSWPKNATGGSAADFGQHLAKIVGKDKEMGRNLAKKCKVPFLCVCWENDAEENSLSFGRQNDVAKMPKN